MVPDLFHILTHNSCSQPRKWPQHTRIHIVGCSDTLQEWRSPNICLLAWHSLHTVSSRWYFLSPHILPRGSSWYLCHNTTPGFVFSVLLAVLGRFLHTSFGGSLRKEGCTTVGTS
jgi:hypothetical protein